MATVEMTFTPLPAHVRTARLVATAVARRSGVAENLLDEVRLAVGEACSRAVEVHQRHCPGEPVRVALTGDPKRFEVVVTNTAAGGEEAGWSALPAGGGQPGGGYRADGTGDADGAGGEGMAEFPAALPGELGLAVIAGLADDVQVSRSGAGLSIRMSWPTGQGTGQVPADTLENFR
jgi:Histidine kinase-like ATPase domain